MGNRTHKMAFVEQLGAEGVHFFNEVASSQFSEQAIAFLNAYWSEVGSQAEFIFSVAFEVMKYADMEQKGISLVHLYEEGVDLEFDTALRFYEILCRKVDPNFAKKEDAEFLSEAYKPSHPEMLTALKRKQELKEKVDVNFDGRVSFLEYLLYQYKDVANPADFVTRSKDRGAEDPELTAAKAKLAEVTAAIRAYEAEKARLTDLANNGTGVKALKAKNELAQLDSGPLMETLNVALITAEAAVRRVNKQIREKGGQASEGHGRKSVAAEFSDGGVFWLNRDLEEKQKLYGKTKK